MTMSESTAISSTAPARKAPKSKTDQEDRPRNNSPAFLAYEAKKAACDARIADIRSRIVINRLMYIPNVYFNIV